MNKEKSILIVTGGTGGHVFPGLVLAQAFQQSGYQVTWLGTEKGIEAKLVPQAEIPLDFLQVTGLRGKGYASLVYAPWRLLRALWQAHRVIKKRRPDLVIGLGGFVSGPGGLAAFLHGIPLVLHEQNAVAGITNRFLAHFARLVFSSFPHAFKSDKILVTGNPVRKAILDLPAPALRFQARTDPIRILILGGSQGAIRLNELLPEALQLVQVPLSIWHQTGEATFLTTTQAYQASSLDYRVERFIDNMAEAYGWADLVICRAGATTIAELIAAGLGAILIPYPNATDDHQTANALYLVQGEAGILMPQASLTVALLVEKMNTMAQRDACLRLSLAARALYQGDAAAQIVENCEDILNEKP